MVQKKVAMSFRLARIIDIENCHLFLKKCFQLGRGQGTRNTLKF